MPARGTPRQRTLPQRETWRWLMLNFATEQEVKDLAHTDFRILTRADFKEFRAAYQESMESMSTFLDLAFFSRKPSFEDMWSFFNQILRDRSVDMYGLFDGERILGIGSYSYSNLSRQGCQIVLWMRKGYVGKKVGTYMLKRLTSVAFYEKKFRFAELIIDKENEASRRAAKKVGYMLIEIMDAHTQGTKGSGKYCRYLCYDGELEGLAGNYGRQPIDLLDHPAYDKEFRYLIHNEAYNYLCKWRGPLIEKTEFDYPPFTEEEMEFFEFRPKAPQSRIKLSRVW